MKFFRLSRVIPATLLALALTPAVARHWEAWRVSRQVPEAATDIPAVRSSLSVWGAQTSALAIRIDQPSGLLTSWQTVGGCGAGSGGGSNIGLKWIGRNVHGGLFNVQEQSTFTKIGSNKYPEYHFFFNTLISRDFAEKFNLGVNLPFAHKYLVDPQHLGSEWVAPIDYSNTGFGDMSLLFTRKFGRINDMSLTASIGFPTGKYREKFDANERLHPGQQIGFGPSTTLGPFGSVVNTFGLTFDKTFDEVWGLWLVGASANYRGSKNKIENYRAPSGSLYSYVGYFLGPLVPAVGLSLTGYTGHDRDVNAVMYTPLVSVAANASLEWSSDWIAVLVAGSYPYGYHGHQATEGTTWNAWHSLPWTVSLGVSMSPF
jgi:hypothetical protein